MDRREFLRRFIMSSVMGVAAISGVVALFDKANANQAAGPNLSNQLTLQGSTSSTTVQNSATGSSLTPRQTENTTSTQPSAASSTQSPSSPSLTTSIKQNTGATTSSATKNSAQSSSSTSAGATPPSGYILLAPLSALNGKVYAYFNHPKFGSSILINYNGTWKAFSAVCTHAGCSVNYTSSSLYCPCHAGYFSPVDGSVVSGPPPSGLPRYDVKPINNNLYVSNSTI